MKYFYLIVFLPFFACESPKVQSPEIRDSKEVKKVWVDADLAIGVQNPNGLFGDVDDGYALMHLLLSEKVEVAGISTVFGNTDIDNAFRLGKEMRDKFASPDVAVYKGAERAIDLDDVKSNEAVEALARALDKEAMHIMAIGPATNIGLLLLLYPEKAKQIKSVNLVAGRRSIDQHFQASESHDPPFPDLNFDLDPDAFRVLLQHDIRLNLHPFEISHKVWFGREELAQLAESGEGGKYLADRSQHWLEQWGLWGADKYNPFDLLASGYLISEKGYQYEELPAEIVIAPSDTDVSDSSDRLVYKPYLILSPGSRSKRKAFYFHTPPADFTQSFLQYFE